jgi:DNA-binding MarR family transcriptional regulator
MTSTPSTALTPTELAAWRGLLEAHATLIAQLDAELSRDQGLPLTSYEVLISLADADSERLRMGELAERLLLSRSGITRLIDRLERQGLVERQRCDDDGRGLFAAITAEGKRRLATARPAHLDGVRRHFLSRLRPTDLDALAGAWRRVLVPAANDEA